MRIDAETAAEFLDAINDYLSNGDIHIEAITGAEASRMQRDEMNQFLRALMAEVLKLEQGE